MFSKDLSGQTIVDYAISSKNPMVISVSLR